MKRKFLCLVMILSLILSLGNTAFLFADNLEEDDDNNNPPPPPTTTPIIIEVPQVKREDPNLILQNLRMPVFEAGTEVDLTIPLQNTSSTSARNVMVSLVVDDINNFPFELDRNSTTQRVGSISGRVANSQAVRFKLRVRSNAEEKTYPIRVNVEYTSESGGSFNLSETIYIKITNDNRLPSLKLHQLEIEGGKLVGGTAKNAHFTIQNAGDLLAKDVEVQLAGFQGNQLILDSTIDTVSVSKIEGRHMQKVSFRIYADPQLETGNYTLDLKMKYKDEHNVSYTTETKVYLPVEGSGSRQTTFSFDHLSYPQGEIEPYTDFKISFDLKNTGAENANNVKVSIDAGEEILPKSMSVKNLGNLTAGKGVPVEFTMFAKDNIESKNYPIKIAVEYETGSGSRKEVQTINQYVGVYINSNDRDMGTPKVMVDWYDYGAEFIKAGEAFPLSISFYNTNRSSDVRNIRVSLTSEGDVFSPVGSSNSFFIQEIPAGARAEKTVTLRPKIDAAYKTHNIFAEIEYEDTKGKSYNTKELIGIPVIQEANLVMGDIALSNENFVGIPIALSLEFYNAGRGLMRNMLISIEGNFDTNEGSLYIGNLEAGKNNYYDVTIIPTTPGTLNGKIIFEYDDEIDQHYTLEKEFSLEIMEQMQHFMPEPFIEPENMSNNSSKMKVVGGIGVVLLLGVGGFIYYKRRKKKLEEVDIYE